MILQLNPPWPVETSKGPGFAMALIDYSQEHDTIFKVCITATGEYWDLPQSAVRGVMNITMGRGRPNIPEKPSVPPVDGPKSEPVSRVRWADYYTSRPAPR